jgi:outer membrane lipoprotein SlyB
MRRTISILTLAVAVAAAGCDRAPNRSTDTTLNTDLSLAAQQRGYQPLDSLSAAERAAAGAPALATSPQRTPTHRTSSGGDVARSRRSGSSSGSSRASAPVTQSSGTIEKHTKRDAAIGAAAGAVIGATASRNKVKGGLIGAAVGGILGGVIGNNVDKKRKP